MTDEEPTVDELMAGLAKARAERLQQCSQEIDMVLEKYGMELGAIPRITGDGRLSAEPIIAIKKK